jgi:hypothetical protein
LTRAESLSISNQITALDQFVDATQETGVAPPPSPPDVVNLSHSNMSFPKVNDSAIDAFPVLTIRFNETIPVPVVDVLLPINASQGEEADSSAEIEDIVCAWDGEVEVFRSGHLSKLYVEQEAERRRPKTPVATIPFLLEMLGEEFVEIGEDLRSVCSRSISTTASRNAGWASSFLRCW